MPILQYETRVSPDGTIVIPPIPEYRDRKVIVCVHEERDEHGGAFLERSEGNDKTPEQEQSEERQKAAGQKFFDTWDGLLEGMPDMTAKEIRAERLERKYGQ